MGVQYLEVINLGVKAQGKIDNSNTYVSSETMSDECDEAPTHSPRSLSRIALFICLCLASHLDSYNAIEGKKFSLGSTKAALWTLKAQI